MASRQVGEEIGVPLFFCSGYHHARAFAGVRLVGEPRQHRLDATAGEITSRDISATASPSPALARIDKARHGAVGFRHGRHQHDR